MRILKYFGYTVILCVVVSVLFVLYAPVFGGSQSMESLQRINNSRNFVEGKFANQMATSVSTRSPDRKSSIMVTRGWYLTHFDNRDLLKSKKIDLGGFRNMPYLHGPICEICRFSIDSRQFLTENAHKPPCFFHRILFEIRSVFR